MGKKPAKAEAKRGGEESANAKPAREANPLIEMLAETAGFEDVDRFVEEFSERKNAQYAEAFARVPYGQRLLLVPQCLRSSGDCQADEHGVSYECARCGACSIDAIIEEAERLGYMGVHILKGGRAVVQLIEKYKPRAILGVACNYEGLMGIMECERRGVPVQFAPLLRDGCADTEVDLEMLREFLSVLK